MFELGNVVATPASLTVLNDNGILPITLLLRHKSGEWSELTEDDIEANREAVKNGDTVFSKYTINGVKLYVITEWDRSSTTILLAEEY